MWVLILFIALLALLCIAWLIGRVIYLVLFWAPHDPIYGKDLPPRLKDR